MYSSTNGIIKAYTLFFFNKQKQKHILALGIITFLVDGCEVEDKRRKSSDEEV